MNVRTCCFALLIAVFLGSTGMAVVPDAHAAKVIRFAYETGKNSPYARCVQLFKSEVEKRTNGSLKVNIFYGGSLAGGIDALQMVKAGNCEMYMEITGPLGTFMYKELTVLDVPYLFDNMEHQYAFLKSPIAQKLMDNMREATGVRVLGFIPSYLRAIASTKRITTPDDLKGVKIRSAQSAIDVETWQRLGAQPVTLPWGEIYTSLATNMVGGLAAAPSSLLNSKFDEVCKFLVLTNHQTFIETYIINEAFYQKLTPAEQTAINEAMKLVVELYIKLGIEGTDEFPNAYELAKKAGMEVVEPDREAFKKALSGIEKQFIPSDFSLELYESIKNLKY